MSTRSGSIGTVHKEVGEFLKRNEFKEWPIRITDEGVLFMSDGNGNVVLALPPHSWNYVIKEP